MKREDVIAKYQEPYSRTEYRVLLSAGPVVLRVGLFDALIQDRLRSECHLQREWVVLTPCNPRSTVAREQMNNFYFNELKYELESHAGDWFKALNHDPTGQWPDEPGFLIIDPDMAWIHDVARRFGQHALVAGRIDEAPRLVWL